MILSGLYKFKNDLSDSIVFVNEEFELVVDGFVVGLPMPPDRPRISYLLSSTYFGPPKIFDIVNILAHSSSASTTARA